MNSILVQLLLVIFLVSIATYDTLQSRRNKMKKDSDKTGEFLKLQH